MIPAWGARTGGCAPRLLIVDDIVIVRRMLAELFAQAGYEAEEAGDAREALELARLVRWDGFVLDVDMPGMNGLELYARFVGHYGDHRLPVVFFTGRPDRVLALSLAGSPWARVVAKPCDGRRLVRLMEQCLQAGRTAAASDA